MPGACSIKRKTCEGIEIIFEAAVDSRHWYYVLKHLRQELISPVSPLAGITSRPKRERLVHTLVSTRAMFASIKSAIARMIHGYQTTSSIEPAKFLGEMGL
jgi:hypothetical protein